MAWGEARIQVEAVRDQVTELVTAGWSLSKIYRKLHSDGSLTVSYRRFYDFAKKVRSAAIQAQGHIASSPATSSRKTTAHPQQSTAAARTASPPLARGQLMVRMPHDDDPEATAHALIYGDDSNGDDL